MAKDRPNILDIAPAAQDATRVAQPGLIQEEQVPGGQNVDWDIFAEEAVRMGFPPGMIGDLAEKAKTDPKVAKALIGEARKWQTAMKNNPDLKKKLSPGMTGR